MKRVYIAHQLGSGLYRHVNRRGAAKWVVWCAEQGHCPMASWVILSEYWDESRRDEGLAVDFAQIESCDELWLCGPCVSPGMKLEWLHALKHGITVADMTRESGVFPQDFFKRFPEVAP